MNNPSEVAAIDTIDEAIAFLEEMRNIHGGNMRLFIVGYHDYGVGRLSTNVSPTSVVKTNNQKDGDCVRVFKQEVCGSNDSVQAVLWERW